MRTITTLLAGAAGLAAITAAVPASAQAYGYTQPTYGYTQSYGYTQPYGYAQTYGQNYGYGQNSGYAQNSYASSVGQRQCTAAVQSRLYNRTSLGSILGSLVGVPQSSGRVVGITSIQPRGYGMTRISGLATSGRYASNNYSPYGVGAYGALGYNSAASADLNFRCDVDARGYVRNVSVSRRY
ncbi:MAG: hypothetical protein ABIW33_04180 [Sphingomicrobium sp.]